MTHRAITCTAVILLVVVPACAPSGTGTPDANDNAASNDNGTSNDNATTTTNDNTGVVAGDEEQFVANLDADQQTSPVESPATGAGTFLLDGDRTQIGFQINAAGLSSAVVAAHFRRGHAGEDGDIIYDLTALIQQDGGNVSISGVWPFDATPFIPVAEIVDLLHESGIYVNMHTINFPDGEVRGQLTVPGGDE